MEAFHQPCACQPTTETMESPEGLRGGALPPWIGEGPRCRGLPGIIHMMMYIEDSTLLQLRQAAKECAVYTAIHTD